MKVWEKAIIFGVCANLVFICSLHVAFKIVDDMEEANAVKTQCKVMACYMGDYDTLEPVDFKNSSGIEEKLYWIMMDIKLSVNGVIYITTDSIGISKASNGFSYCFEVNLSGNVVTCYYNKKFIGRTLSLFKDRAKFLHPIISILTIVSFVMFWVIFCIFLFYGIVERCKRGQ